MSNAGLFVATGEDYDDYDIRAEAERQGKGFIELRLNRKEARRGGQDGVRFVGVRVINGYKGPPDRDGIETIQLDESGGALHFKFDRAKREFVAYLFDDKTPGPHSATGYNRDFLASHLVGKSYEDQPFYIVENKAVEKDVEARMKIIQEKIKKKEEQKKSEGASSILSIDEEMKRLEKRRAELLEAQGLTVTKGDLSNPVMQPDKVEDKSKRPVGAGVNMVGNG
jgi:hypothetical protein